MKARVTVTISFIVDEGDMNDNLRYAEELSDEMQSVLFCEENVIADIEVEKI